MCTMVCIQQLRYFRELPRPCSNTVILHLQVPAIRFQPTKLCCPTGEPHQVVTGDIGGLVKSSADAAIIFLDLEDRDPWLKAWGARRDPAIARCDSRHHQRRSSQVKPCCRESIFAFQSIYTVGRMDSSRNGFKMEIELRKEGFEACARTFPVCTTLVVAESPVGLGCQARVSKVDIQNKLHKHPPFC